MIWEWIQTSNLRWRTTSKIQSAVGVGQGELTRYLHVFMKRLRPLRSSNCSLAPPRNPPLSEVTGTGWWFGTFAIFPYIGINHPN